MSLVHVLLKRNMDTPFPITTSNKTTENMYSYEYSNNV